MPASATPGPSAGRSTRPTTRGSRAEGLRYNRFHVTALCSPTRAALLTGRNSHAVGFGSVGEFSTGFPGYTAFVPDDCAPFPRILRDNGYSTAAFGKWHLTPDGQQGPAGPFDRWPVGWGFDYFYGFLGGGSGQWDPCLTENQKIIGTPDGLLRRGGPLLPARRHGRQDDRVAARDPRRRTPTSRSSPTSRPAAATPRTTSPRSGRRSTRASSTRAGTSCARRRSPGRRQLGVIPADAELTPRDDAFPAWDDVPDKLKAYYARQMEVYAGYSENADHNVGRVLDAIDELGELDNTLVHLDLGRQRRQHGGHDHRLVQRADDAERHPADRRDAAAARRALRRRRGVGQPDDGAALLGRLGLGGQHAVQVGQAGRLAPRRHAQPAGRPLARADHGRRARCGRTSPT